MGLV
ncbi:hypothetical protein CGLO_17087 [Colletotrichum gloeosporioides Cg-14]|jgi:uncharacterized membrane protein YeaQ/YmgE (transglycosylase-associated protein family)